MSISPNDAGFIAGLGGVMTWAGDYEGGMTLVNKAIRLNPRHPVHYVWYLGHAYYLTGQLDRAIEMFERASVLNPDWWPSHVYSAICLVEMGRIEDARAAAEKALKAQPTFSVGHWVPHLPYKNQRDIDRWADGLRKTGLT